MKSLLLITLFISITICSSLKGRDYYEKEFQQFLKCNDKIYASNEEYNFRLGIFASNIDKINAHNAKKSSYELGINLFADLTVTEFIDRALTGYVKMTGRHLRKTENERITSPQSFDWDKKGAVTPVKDQGQCGSCYAFAAIGALESAYFIKNSKLVTFSEQQIVDCSRSYGNRGCSGGNMVFVYKYVSKSGICEESEYPYHAKDETCKECKPVTKMTNFVHLEMKEAALEPAVLINPLSVGIDATDIQLYKKGIFDSNCMEDLNHGVLIVGYGEENGVKFWRIKNSWGKKYGEDGYIRFIKDAGIYGGQCGIAIDATYPII